MLVVQGRSDIQLILMIVKCVLALGPIALGIFCGIYWMLVGSVLNGWISLFLNAYYSGRKFKYTAWNQLKDVIPSFMISFAVAILVLAISFIPMSYFIKLPIQIIVGALVTIMICEKTQLDEYKQLKGIILSTMQKFRR